MVRPMPDRGLRPCSVVIAAGHGIVMAHDANQLAENGGTIKLTNDWGKNVLKRMGYINGRLAAKQKLTLNNLGS